MFRFKFPFWNNSKKQEASDSQYDFEKTLETLVQRVLKDNLTNVVEQLIIKCVDAKMDSFGTLLTELRNTIDKALISPLNEDRKEIADTLLIVKQNKALMEALRDEMHSQTQQVVNKVADQMEPVTEVVAKATTDAVHKEMKKLSEQEVK
jgi:hypothetical protein